MASKGKQKLFGHLKAYLVAMTSTVPYRDIAAEVDMNEGAVRVFAGIAARHHRAVRPFWIVLHVAIGDQPPGSGATVKEKVLRFMASLKVITISLATAIAKPTISSSGRKPFCSMKRPRSWK